MKGIVNHLKENWIRYALETLVVVVGVLGAFSLNNWNEIRKNRIDEAYYLHQIRGALEVDIELLESEIALTRNKVIKCERFINELNAPGDVSSFNSTFLEFVDAVQVPRYQPNTSTFNELQSIGKLSIFSNKELINQLIQLYNSYDFLLLQLKIEVDFLLVTDIEFFINGGMGKYKNPSFQLFKNFVDDEMIYELRTQKEFLENNAMNHYWSGIGIMKEFEPVLSNAQNVLNVINEEIKNHQ
jgi:hypothetical protein